MNFTSFFIKKEENYRKYAHFECSCGNKGIIRADTKRKNGCSLCSPQIKHNMCNSPEYNSWKGMKRRCLNENSNEYKLYGGSGIKICEKWLGEKGFERFLQDMGRRPGAQYSLDRVNPYGNYEPDNCRWATPIMQSNNQRFFGRRILCIVCDRPFLRGQATNKYCSVSCRDFGARKPGKKRIEAEIINRKRSIKLCLICKNKFMAISYQKYCSYLCSYIVQKEKQVLKNRLRKNADILNT